MEVKNILFPTDFSPAAKLALEHAVLYAEVFDAKLHILHGVTCRDGDPTVRLPDVSEIYDKMEAAAQVQMKETIDPHKEKPLEIVEITLRGGTPDRMILKYIEEQKIDMVIMANHGRQGIQHFLLGSVAESVARLAKCPVLTVRESGHHIRPIDRILVPIDFSEQSKYALSWAKQIADVFTAEITLFHVVQSMVYPVAPDPVAQSMDSLLPELENSRESLIHALEREAGDGYEMKSEVVVGTPYHAVIDHAKKHDSDLIVMGTHGFSGITHLILGSTAERVIRMAPCPILTVKLLR